MWHFIQRKKIFVFKNKTLNRALSMNSTIFGLKGFHHEADWREFEPEILRIRLEKGEARQPQIIPLFSTSTVPSSLELSLPYTHKSYFPSCISDGAIVFCTRTCRPPNALTKATASPAQGREVTKTPACLFWHLSLCAALVPEDPCSESTVKFFLFQKHKRKGGISLLITDGVNIVKWNWKAVKS